MKAIPSWWPLMKLRQPNFLEIGLPLSSVNPGERITSLKEAFDVSFWNGFHRIIPRGTE
jgi:hypothetical protein